jgi:hypothetical protein
MEFSSVCSTLFGPSRTLCATRLRYCPIFTCGERSALPS